MFPAFPCKNKIVGTDLEKSPGCFIKNKCKRVPSKLLMNMFSYGRPYIDGCGTKIRE